MTGGHGDGPAQREKRVAVTGGTGFIGRSLIGALLRRGWAVTALVRHPAAPEADAIRRAGATLVRGDITDRASLKPAFAGADAVIHNAAWLEVGIRRAQRPHMRAVNVDGTRTVLDVATTLGIPKIVYTSTVAAFGGTGTVPADETAQRARPFRSWYERTKTEAHAVAIEYQQRGAPMVIVCPTYVIGPGDQSPWGCFLRIYVRGILPPVAFGRNAIHSAVHVDDVAEAIVLALEHGRVGETYIVSGEALSVERIVQIWAETPGGFVPRIWVPRWVAMGIGAVAEPLLRVFGLRAFISRETMAVAYEHWIYSAAKAERELGARFRPARQLWLDTLAAERAVLRRRHRGSEAPSGATSEE